jgi:hypothetical protein
LVQSYSSSEISLDVLSLGNFVDRISRPVRSIPPHVGFHGVIYRRRVYPLQNKDQNQDAELFIDIAGTSFEPGRCPVVRSGPTAVDTTLSRTNVSELSENPADSLSRFVDPEVQVSLQHIVQGLSGKEIQILNARFNEKRTIESVGSGLRLTSARIRQIERKALRKVAVGLSPSRYVSLITSISQSVTSLGGIVHRDEISDALSCSPLWILIVERYHAFSSRPPQEPSLHTPLFFSEDFVSAYENLDELSSVAEDLVGPSKIMRLDQALLLLKNRITPSPNNLETEPRQFGKSVQLIGGWNLVPCNSAEEYQRGLWVETGLPKAALECAQAIIYANVPTDPAVTQSTSTTVSSDILVEWLSSRLGVERNERAIDGVCSRYPAVFIRTSKRSWGLIGAGNIPNVSLDEPSIATPHGAVIKAVTTAVMESHDGITENQVLTAVRSKYPDASAVTIRLYLTRLHRERFEQRDDGRFVIRESFLDARNNGSGSMKSCFPSCSTSNVTPST